MSKSWMAKHFTKANEGEWIEHAPDTIHYEWCCDCSLRHIVEYRIIKNAAGDLVIQRRSWRDDFATELRRRLAKLEKRNEKKQKSKAAQG